MEKLQFACGLVTAIVLTPSIAFGQIRPLDDARLNEAISEKTSPPPNDLRIARLQNGRGLPDLETIQRMQRWPFTITIETPYYRANTIAGEARRKFLPAPAISITELNAQQVIVHVTSGPNFLESDTVEGLVIKRGDTVVRPTRELVRPTTIRNAMGASRASADGFFEFPIEAFSPEAGPYTVVVIGKGGNFEWPVTGDDLYAMKD